MMSGVWLETCWAVKEHWNNKFYYTASVGKQKIMQNQRLKLQFLSSWWWAASLETCWAIKKHWNNKFYYTVASSWLFLYDLYYDARIHEYHVGDTLLM